MARAARVERRLAKEQQASPSGSDAYVARTEQLEAGRAERAAQEAAARAQREAAARAVAEAKRVAQVEKEAAAQERAAKKAAAAQQRAAEKAAREQERGVVSAEDDDGPEVSPFVLAGAGGRALARGAAVRRVPLTTRHPIAHI